jgi:hypothetical protein
MMALPDLASAMQEEKAEGETSSGSGLGAAIRKALSSGDDDAIYNAVEACVLEVLKKQEG